MQRSHSRLQSARQHVTKRCSPSPYPRTAAVMPGVRRPGYPGGWLAPRSRHPAPGTAPPWAVFMCCGLARAAPAAAKPPFRTSQRRARRVPLSIQETKITPGAAARGGIPPLPPKKKNKAGGELQKSQLKVASFPPGTHPACAALVKNNPQAAAGKLRVLVATLRQQSPGLVNVPKRA